MYYEKAQFARIWTIALLLGAIATVVFFLTMEEGGDKALSSAILLSSLLLCILLLFYQLKVSLKKDRIALSYGIGLIRINLKIDKVLMVEEIKTPWYYGFGIRFTPKGILYNIQGTKAINLVYEYNGRMKKAMIGTEEPQKLMEAIQKSYPTEE